jgi:hypothetical protein
MKTRRTLWRDLGVVALAAASVAAYMLAAGIAGEAGFPLDDAWIHQTYARNLAHGGQWLFVPGEPPPLPAPLYTLLLYVGYLLDCRTCVDLSAGVGGAGAGGLIAHRLGRPAADRSARAGGWAVWRPSGLAPDMGGRFRMETMLFASLTGPGLAGWREMDFAGGFGAGRAGARGDVWPGGRGGTRPGPRAGLVALFGLLLWIARPGSGWRWLFTWSVGAGLGWLAGFVPYAMLNMSLGGELLPNTASAKQAENAILLAASYPSRIASLLLPILAGGQLLLLPGWVVAVLLVVRKSPNPPGLVLLPRPWGDCAGGLYAARLPAPSSMADM